MGVLAALLRERARVAGSGNPDGLLFDSCADRIDSLEQCRALDERTIAAQRDEIGKMRAERDSLRMLVAAYQLELGKE